MDELTAIAVLLVEGALCPDCIAAKSGVAREAVPPFLRTIERGLTVFVSSQSCPHCGRLGLTYSLLSA